MNESIIKGFHKFLCPRINANLGVRAHTHTHTHVPNMCHCVYTNTCTTPCTHTCACTHTHTHTAHTHTHTHTRTCTHRRIGHLFTTASQYVHYNCFITDTYFYSIARTNTRGNHNAQHSFNSKNEGKVLSVHVTAPR